jgi:hypothetical protein
MTLSRPDSPLVLRPGDIVNFAFLHLNEAAMDPASQEPNDEGKYLYKIWGKPRPMLVLYTIDEENYGIKWYRVLKLTTKGHRADRRRKRDHLVLGKILGQQVTFAENKPHSYPENLVSGQIKATLPAQALGGILKRICLESIGMPASR